MGQPDRSDKAGDDLLTDISSILADLPPSDASLDLGNPEPVRDIFAAHTRKGWDKTTEARCNFDFRPRLTPRAGVWFLSLWQKSLMGRTLTEIKSDPAEIPHFAGSVSDFISRLLGPSVSNGTWCICTTPKRRHKEHNFASLISSAIASRLSIPFYDDVALCRSRQRVNAVFTLNVLPEQPNVIVFDDFVTTGSTLGAMSRLLLPLGKTLLFVAGINNKL